jgi:hypothetical protein
MSTFSPNIQFEEVARDADVHGLVEFRSGHHHARSVVRLLEAGIILGNENTSRAGLRKESERNERDCAERA